MSRFDWKELRTPRGGPTGCFAWHYGLTPMCDHEHDEGEQLFACEDARSEMSRIRAAQLRSTESVIG